MDKRELARDVGVGAASMAALRSAAAEQSSLRVMIDDAMSNDEQ